MEGSSNFYLTSGDFQHNSQLCLL